MPRAPTLEAYSLVLWPPIESSVAHALTCVGSTFHNGDVRGKYHGRIHDCHGHVLHSKGAKPACRILVYVTFTLMLSTGKLQPNPAGSFDERNWFVRHSHYSDWSSHLVSAQIISGFLSFGVLHITKSALHPWQWCRPCYELAACH